jgi:hypothetical protein
LKALLFHITLPGDIIDIIHDTIKMVMYYINIIISYNEIIKHNSYLLLCYCTYYIDKSLSTKLSLFSFHFEASNIVLTYIVINILLHTLISICVSNMLLNPLHVIDSKVCNLIRTDNVNDIIVPKYVTNVFFWCNYIYSY